MNTEDVVHIYNGILLSHKKEQNWVIWRDVNEQCTYFFTDHFPLTLQKVSTTGQGFLSVFFFSPLPPRELQQCQALKMLTKYVLKRWLSSQHHILHSLTQPPKTHV